METRRTSYLLIAVMVSAVALAPWRGAALPGGEGLEHIPVQGSVSHDGGFVGDLTIVAFTVGDTGQLHLTGVLNGTATRSTGATTQVAHQTFIAPATLLDSDRTTDVLLLKIVPITLAPAGGQITLAPITLDIDIISSQGNVLTMLLHEQ